MHLYDCFRPKEMFLFYLLLFALVLNKKEPLGIENRLNMFENICIYFNIYS